MKFRKKPVVIEATQWFKLGDHPAVVPVPYDHPADRNSLKPGDWGWVPTLEGGHLVTPGDWIITGVQGENYPCKPDIFAATYEPADVAALPVPSPQPNPPALQTLIDHHGEQVVAEIAANLRAEMPSPSPAHRNPERVKKLARSFAQEWLRPDRPEGASEMLTVSLVKAMTAFYAVARSADEHDNLNRAAPSPAVDLKAVQWLIRHYLPTPSADLGDHNYVTISGPYGAQSMRVGDWRAAQTELAEAGERLRAAIPQQDTREMVAKFRRWHENTPNSCLDGNSRVAFDAGLRTLRQLEEYLDGDKDLAAYVDWSNEFHAAALPVDGREPREKEKK